MSTSIDVLVPGLLIETKFSNSSRWISNIIESVNDDVICIPLSEEYLNENILSNDSIIIEYIDSIHQYIINGTIINIDLNNTQTMTIKINDFATYKNKRNSSRYNTSLGASINLNSNSTSSVAIVTNISMTGICFICKKEFEMGEIISIDVLSTTNNMLKFKGKIVRTKQCDYGKEYAIELDKTSEIAQNISVLVKNIETDANTVRESLFKKFNTYLKVSSKTFFNARILIIENSNLVRMILKNSINTSGITSVFEASNSKDALDKVKLYKPDIICISSIIYEVENPSILDQIYSINSSIKIIMISSNSKEEFDQTLIDKYNIEYMPKTFNFDGIVDIIKKNWK